MKHQGAAELQPVSSKPVDLALNIIATGLAYLSPMHTQ